MTIDHVMDRSGIFPSMPWADWRETKATLHRFAQVVGKVRLASTVRRNHWWNIPFHLTGRGITTRPMGLDPVFCIDFDFVDHRLVVNSSTGRTISFPLVGQSVASFYGLTLHSLSALGIHVVVDKPEPFDLGDHIPFADDTEHAAIWGCCATTTPGRRPSQGGPSSTSSRVPTAPGRASPDGTFRRSPARARITDPVLLSRTPDRHE